MKFINLTTRHQRIRSNILFSLLQSLIGHLTYVFRAEANSCAIDVEFLTRETDLGRGRQSHIVSGFCRLYLNSGNSSFIDKSSVSEINALQPYSSDQLCKQHEKIVTKLIALCIGGETVFWGSQNQIITHTHTHTHSGTHYQIERSLPTRCKKRTKNGSTHYASFLFGGPRPSNCIVQ
jgi:hypothetical protein